MQNVSLEFSHSLKCAIVRWSKMYVISECLSVVDQFIHIQFIFNYIMIIYQKNS